MFLQILYNLKGFLATKIYIKDFFRAYIHMFDN